MEEELQHSVRASEGDADRGEVGAAGSNTEEQTLANPVATTSSPAAAGMMGEDIPMNGDTESAAGRTMGQVDENEHLDNHGQGDAPHSEKHDPDMDAEGEEDDDPYEDAEGDEFEDASAQPLPEEDVSGVEEDGDAEDEDGEGEEVQVDDVQDEDARDEDGDGEEDDDEGVGAVKLRPGETDDEDSEDDDASEPIASDEESEDDAEWEDAVENEEGEDGESENESPNICIFCKQDEENDPGEEFEAFLACSGCGENG